jgi:hypothetical protein
MNTCNNKRAVLSVRSVPRGYKKDKEGRLSQLSSGVGSWQNNGKRGITLCKEDFIVYCSDSENVINPLPGYDF